MAPNNHDNRTPLGLLEPPTHAVGSLALVAVVAAVATGVAILAPSTGTFALLTALYFGLAAYVGSNFAPDIGRVLTFGLWGGLAAGTLVGGAPSAGTVSLIYGIALLAIVEGLSRFSRRLRVDATTDALTGLRNRLGLQEECNRAIAVCRRLGQPLSLVHIDLDGFKQVNDSSGHAAGDRVLIRCADAWRSELRAGDILARIGGDEFLIILPGSNRDEAALLIQRLLAVSPIQWCCGIAELEDDEDFMACLARADRELYAEKAARRGRSRSQGRGHGALRSMHFEAQRA